MPVPPERDLYSLLDLPPDTPVARVRYVYEQHMSAAVRSHDNARALALSRAFDRLPATDRRAAYSTIGRSAGGPPIAPTRRAAAKAHRTPRRAPLVRKRFLVAVVAAAALTFAGSLILNHSHTDEPPTTQRFVPTSVEPAAPPALPVMPPASPNPPATVTRSVQVPVFVTQVPLTAPTEANGMVSVGCQTSAGGVIDWSYAHRGQYVSCGTGSTLVIPGT